MDWCGSPTPETPEFQTINEEGYKILVSTCGALCLAGAPFWGPVKQKTRNDTNGAMQ
jgi:hypothetical protein